MRATISRTSALAADAGAVWAHATSPRGINAELRPWLRMTVPRGLRGMTIDDVTPGIAIGRSWILAFGVLPVDFDDLTLVEVEPGRRFLERSPMGSMRFWEHERTIEPAGPAAYTVTDRVTFEPRVPFAGRLARRALGAFFAHRHRRLAARFGSAAHDVDPQRRGARV